MSLYTLYAGVETVIFLFFFKLFFFKNINFYSNIFNIVSKNIKTNLNFIDLVMDFEKYKGFDLFVGNVISSANYLKASKSITGQFILLPKSGNFLNLQDSILNLI